jgi:hypothetical protein
MRTGVHLNFHSIKFSGTNPMSSCDLRVLPKTASTAKNKSIVKKKKKQTNKRPVPCFLCNMNTFAHSSIHATGKHRLCLWSPTQDKHGNQLKIADSLRDVLCHLPNYLGTDYVDPMTLSSKQFMCYACTHKIVKYGQIESQRMQDRTEFARLSAVLFGSRLGKSAAKRDLSPHQQKHDVTLKGLKTRRQGNRPPLSAICGNAIGTHSVVGVLL